MPAAPERLVWETAEQSLSGEAELEFARIWRPIPTVVCTGPLTSAAGNARLPTDDIATQVGRLRDQPGEGVVSIGEASLVGDAIAEDLIDDYRQFVDPVILGSSTAYFPPLATPLDLRLTEFRTPRRNARSVDTENSARLSIMLETGILGPWTGPRT